jgi:hypothetical protein
MKMQWAGVVLALMLIGQPCFGAQFDEEFLDPWPPDKVLSMTPQQFYEAQSPRVKASVAGSYYADCLHGRTVARAGRLSARGRRAFFHLYRTFIRWRVDYMRWRVFVVGRGEYSDTTAAYCKVDAEQAVSRLEAMPLESPGSHKEGAARVPKAFAIIERQVKAPYRVTTDFDYRMLNRKARAAYRAAVARYVASDAELKDARSRLTPGACRVLDGAIRAIAAEMAGLERDWDTIKPQIMWSDGDTVNTWWEDKGYVKKWPQRKVLRMTPEEFVEAQRDQSNATYREAMNYYALCLHGRAVARLSKLSYPKRRLLRWVYSSLTDWWGIYELWQRYVIGEGTYWFSYDAEVRVKQEQGLLAMERILARRYRVNGGSGRLPGVYAAVDRDVRAPRVLASEDDGAAARFGPAMAQFVRANRRVKQIRRYLPPAMRKVLDATVQFFYDDRPR